MGEKSFEFLVLSFELGRWERRYLKEIIKGLHRRADDG